MVWPDRLARVQAYMLYQVAQQAHRLLCDHLDTTGLRIQHYRAMAGLAELGECAQAELARALETDAGSLALVLSDLERLGAITRKPDPASRRRNLVRCTEHGYEVLREMDDAVNQANDQLLKSVTAAEREQFHAVLTRINLNER